MTIDMYAVYDRKNGKYHATDCGRQRELNGRCLSVSLPWAIQTAQVYGDCEVQHFHVELIDTQFFTKDGPAPNPYRQGEQS